jgi:hypothetical protein
MASMEQIQQWDRTIRCGGGVSLPGAHPDLSIVIAILRRSRGLGVDETDGGGIEARRIVDAALSEERACEDVSSSTE